MSLPIIRLCAVDVNHAIVVDDPVAASCTLYTFLRSVPTRFDCEMAMGDFKQSVQSPAGLSFFSATNTKMVSLINCCVQDYLFRRLPFVIPALARGAPTWRALLCGEAAGRARETGAAEGAQKAQLGGDKDRLVSSSLVFPSISISQRCDEGEEGVVVKETVSAEAGRFKSPYEQAAPGSSLLASEQHHTGIMAVTTRGIAQKEDSTVGEDPPRHLLLADKSSHPCSYMNYTRSGFLPHKMLLSLLNRICSTIPADENEDDRQEREFVTMMEAKAAALRTKLLSSLPIIPPQEKGALEFVRQMELRFGLAEKLFEVQKYEQETIQITQVALLIEIAAMRALLHKVVDAVAETEERHKREGPHTPFYAEECRIMTAIQQALDELPP